MIGLHAYFKDCFTLRILLWSSSELWPTEQLQLQKNEILVGIVSYANVC
jgi:hypothetical protein